MKQEELIKALIAELFKMDTMHQEYKDNDTHFLIDSQKEVNTLTIKVQLLENKYKREFEQWLEQIDDDLFSEVLDEIKEKEGIKDLDEIYNSKDYQKAIDKIKSKTKEIAVRRIKELQKLL